MAIMRWLPWGTAVLVLLTAGPLGWSRDLGAILLLFAPVPFLIALCAVLIVWAVAVRTARRTALLMLGIILFGAPLTFRAGREVRDPARFVGWYIAHHAAIPALVASRGILADWDSWGLAGMENDSYLVADPVDAFADLAAVNAWLKAQGGECQAIESSRMMPRLYILTTFNCPLR